MTDIPAKNAVKYDYWGYQAARDKVCQDWREKLDQACQGWQAQLEQRAVAEVAHRLQQQRQQLAPPTRINRNLVLRPTPTGPQPIEK